MVVPKWVRWSACALALALGLSAGGSRPLTAQPASPWRDEWLGFLNRQRAESGAPPVHLVHVLNQVAQRQAEEMAATRHLRSPSTDAVSSWLRQVGYSARDWGQEFAIASISTETGRATVRWSPGSRASKATLDRRFRDVGVGAAAIDGGTFYVFLFGWHQGDYFAHVTSRLADRTGIAAEMLARVNAVRRQHGLQPLVLNPVLTRLSQEHAEDMLARSYFGHRTPEGLGPAERALAGGYRSGMGENLATQRYSVEETLDAWLDSPHHRATLLAPHCREMGLGLAIGAGYDAAPGGYRVIWVQSVGRGE